MGLFKRKPEPPPAAPPAPQPPRTCVCGHVADAGAMGEHIDTHITQVTMAGGHPGRSYDCPLCGPADEGWGNPGEHPISLRNMGRALFQRHCRDVHGVEV